MARFAQSFATAGASPAGTLAGLALLAAAMAASGRSASAAAPDNAADLADVGRAAGGDGEAYRRIVERHQRRVAAMMWRFSRDPQTHEEAVQDVFVEAYLSLGTYGGQAPFAHWLARIATRAGYRHWKRLARERAHPVVSLEEWDGAAPERAAQMAPGEAADLLHRVLAQWAAARPHGPDATLRRRAQCGGDSPIDRVEPNDGQGANLARPAEVQATLRESHTGGRRMKRLVFICPPDKGEGGWAIGSEPQFPGGEDERR